MLELRFKISNFVRQTQVCGLSWFRPVEFWWKLGCFGLLGFLLSCHEKHNQSTAKRHGRHIVSAVPLGNGPAPVWHLNYAEPCFYEGGRGGGLEAWGDSRRERIKIKFVYRMSPGYRDNTNQLRPWASWQDSTPWRAPGLLLGTQNSWRERVSHNTPLQLSQIQ